MKRNKKILLKVLKNKDGDNSSNTSSALGELSKEFLSMESLNNCREQRSKSTFNNNLPDETRQLQVIQDKVSISSTTDYNAQMMNPRCSPELVDAAICVPTPDSTLDFNLALATPDAPIYSPITPIDKHTFMSGRSNKKASPVSAKNCDVSLEMSDTSVYTPIMSVDKNVIVPDSSENSSPARSISLSPDTMEVFESLSQSNAFKFGELSDDSTKDHDYIAHDDDDDNDSSSDESICYSSTVTAIAHVHTEKPTSSLKCPPTRQTPQLRINETPMRDADIEVITEMETESSSQFCSELQVSASNLRKRRVSENDLSQTQKPKKVRRSASLSSLILPHENIDKSTFHSPKKRSRSQPAKWKRYIQRDKRMRGEAYKTGSGKDIAARPMKEPRCVTKPKHKCDEYVPESVRKCVYESFRSLKTLEKQRQFIVQHVKRNKKTRSTITLPSRRESTNAYYLTIGGNIQAKVCREFFLDTLNITEAMVRGALNKISSEGVLECDKRGRKSPPNKLSADRLNDLKSHIFSFPTMESHYCRNSTEYKYLDASLCIQKMHSLYKQRCLEEGTVPACLESYRKIFRTYKLKFHVPRKDLCKKCIAQKNEESENKEDYLKHLKRRDDAYLLRDADKQAARDDVNTLAFNFDLEAVLQTPKGAAGPFFYVRKLAVYNLTIYKFGDQDVDCYAWDETEGKRGSIEIATCVYKYILDKEGVTHVRMMSDNCGGQQKNYNFCCMLLHLVTTHPSIELVDHVFYESGHSHMECDSVHSKIEQKSKNIPIYTPDGWTQIMRSARSNPRPFNVNILVHDEFLNFNTNEVKFEPEIKRFKKKRKNKKNETEENESQDKSEQALVTKFNDAVWIQYRKNSPKSIFVKTNYNTEDFTEMKMKCKKGKPATVISVPTYTARIPISKAKKQDLLKLCQDNQIPKYYHPYYESLPDSEGIIDRLPEPDIDEC